MPLACLNTKHAGQLVRVSSNTTLLRNKLVTHSEQAGGMFCETSWQHVLLETRIRIRFPAAIGLQSVGL